jgi:hypothetical protein
MIGGPSYYSPDEGGEPCPDCNAPQIGEDAANGAVGEREALLPMETMVREWLVKMGLYNSVNRDQRETLEAFGDFVRETDAYRAALTAEKVAAEPVASYCPSQFGKQPHAFNHQKCGYCGIAAPQQPAQSAEQDERAAFLSGRDVEELFLRWSEWTTELGEAISRKNIDGFVSDLRALPAAQPVSGGKS